MAHCNLRTHSVSVACGRVWRYALVVRGLPFGQVYDLRAGSVRLDRLNALLGTCSGVITLASGDDLAVGRFEVEPKLSRFVLADLELGCRCSSPCSFPDQQKRYPSMAPRRRCCTGNFRRSSSSSSMCAVLGVRPSSSRIRRRIASSSRSSESMVSMSRMRGAWLEATRCGDSSTERRFPSDEVYRRPECAAEDLAGAARGYVKSGR